MRWRQCLLDAGFEYVRHEQMGCALPRREFEPRWPSLVGREPIAGGDHGRDVFVPRPAQFARWRDLAETEHMLCLRPDTAR
jgi:hypothetical protein